MSRVRHRLSDACSAANALPPFLPPVFSSAFFVPHAGSWLLLWPGWWGIALAAPAGGLPDASMLALFALGTVAMRGAGCTVNDMWDRDVDGQVARTAQRPLASGQLSMKQATVFLAGQLSVAAAVLFQLNVPACVPALPMDRWTEQSND